MSKNTLYNVIKNLILQYQLMPYQQRKINEFFSVIKEGDYIYAGHFKSKLAISIDQAYCMLEELKREGFLANFYEVYCHDCGKSSGRFFDSLEEFDNDLYCDFCEKHFSLEENVIVLYKVIHI